jgi:hypothetical protein
MNAVVLVASVPGQVVRELPAPPDWITSLRRRAQVTLLVGAQDEIFYADRNYPLLGPLRPATSDLFSRICRPKKVRKRSKLSARDRDEVFVISPQKGQ